MPIENFETFEDLIEKIQMDKKSVRHLDNRFPVRFIFLNTFEELREIVRYLSSENVRLIELEKFLSQDNTWLTPEDIIYPIKDLSENGILVPLSEFLRFQDQNSFNITLKSLTELEKNNLRIYIPLVGVWERFEQFWSNFHRKTEWAPIWKLDSKPQKISIYQINFDFNHLEMTFDNFEAIFSTREWLNLWKKENLDAILSFSRPLSFFYRNCLPDQIFDLEVISTYKEFIEIILKGNINIEYDENDADFWKNLANEAINYNKLEITLKDLILKHFNILNIDFLSSDKFIEIYFKTSSKYDQWLIKNFLISLDSLKSTYLYQCCQNLGVERLENKLWMKIFEMENADQNLFTERKNLLKILYEQFNIYPNESKLQIKLETLKNFPLKHQLGYLTNITFVEKKFILEILKEHDISHILTSIRNVYPEIYHYLDWSLIKPDNLENEWIIEYFEEYNYSKIKHSRSKKLELLLNSKNRDISSFSKWFYSIEKPGIEKDYHCIWVDGLGAEWFPLVVYLIDKYGQSKGKSIVQKNIIRTNLPSITECNKYECENKIGDLDKYIHNEHYKNPDTLIKEIDIIENIVKQILDKPFDKLSIVSDHGFTFLCLKDFGNIKRLNFVKSEHQGRCMWIEEKISDDEYFINWDLLDGDQDENVVLASKHVSLNITPSNEVHGGITPEEILVPYILIKTDEDKIEYLIEPISFSVLITNPVINFEISPLPAHIPKAFLNNRQLNLINEKENKYRIILEGVKSGVHLIELKIGNTEFKLNLEIKSGLKETNLI